MGYTANQPFPDIFESTAACPENGCLFQGDIIKFSEGETDIVLERRGDVLGYMVISNSCDLDHDAKMISLVPILPFKFLLDDFLLKLPGKLHTKKVKEEREDRPFNAEAELKNAVAQMIFNEANYLHKFTFFIPALEEFDNLPTIAFIDDVRSIEVNSNEVNSAGVLLRNRICSLKTPWREKLGHKVGYIFNRVSTLTPKSDEIRIWWTDIYNEEYSESLAKI